MSGPNGVERREGERRESESTSSRRPWYAVLSRTRWVALTSVLVAGTLYGALTFTITTTRRLDAIERPTPAQRQRGLERAIGELSTKQAGAIVRRALRDPATRRRVLRLSR